MYTFKLAFKYAASFMGGASVGGMLRYSTLQAIRNNCRAHNALCVTLE